VGVELGVLELQRAAAHAVNRRVNLIG